MYLKISDQDQQDDAHNEQRIYDYIAHLFKDVYFEFRHFRCPPWFIMYYPFAINLLVYHIINQMSIHHQNSAEISHYLGVDFGTSQVGLALGDSEIKIAFAYKTIANDNNFIANLKKIIAREQINIIILGSLAYAGESKKAFEAEKIGDELKKELGVEIEYQEEMFTTKMAEINLKEAGSKKIKELDNQEAARIILQSWLDKN